LNRENALALCFVAVPDGKPLHTFPGTALGEAGAIEMVFAMIGFGSLHPSPAQGRNRPGRFRDDAIGFGMLV
jgi:hypothetical protein